MIISCRKHYNAYTVAPMILVSVQEVIHAQAKLLYFSRVFICTRLLQQTSRSDVHSNISGILFKSFSFFITNIMVGIVKIYLPHTEKVISRIQLIHYNNPDFWEVKFSRIYRYVGFFYCQLFL